MELKLEIPEGYEIDIENSDLSIPVIKYKKKEIKLPTTNKECLPFLPETCYYIGPMGDIRKVSGNERIDPNTVTSKEYEEAFLALMQLIKYRDIWNEGWIADWTDDTWKYTIYFYDDKQKGLGLGKVGGQWVLSFESSKVRDKFSEQFDSLIQTAKPLL